MNKDFVYVEYDKVKETIQKESLEEVKEALKTAIENNNIFLEFINKENAVKYKEENELYKKILEDLNKGIEDKEFIEKGKELAAWTEYRDIFISKAGDECNRNADNADREEKDIEFILKGIHLYFKAHYDKSYAQAYEEYKKEAAEKERQKKEMEKKLDEPIDFTIPM